jgi:hypothetical protein
MNLVVTGSRDWPEDDDELIATVLDMAFWNTGENNHVYVGDAKGVDKMVRDRLAWVEGEVVTYNRVQLHVFKADWDRWGKTAGIIRNSDMLTVANEAGGGIVVAFHASRDHYLDLHRQREGKAGKSGTNHCANLAKRLGFRVYHVIRDAQ